MNLYIFVRHYNDVDQIVPVIYFLCRNSQDVIVTLINTSAANEFSADYRIVFLKELFQISYHNIADLRRKYRIPFRVFLRMHKLFRKHSNSLFLDKIYRKIILQNTYGRLMEGCESTFDFEAILLNNGKSHVFGFDHGSGILINNALKFAKRKHIKTFAYMHGINMTKNHLINTRMNDISMQKHRNILKPFNDFDIVFVNNQIYKERYLSYGVKDEKLRVVGVPRYTHFWNQVLDEITPKAELPVVEDRCLKVVIMLTRSFYNLFEEELLRIIDLLLRFEDVFLILKPHTRELKYYFAKKKGFDFSKKTNLKIVDEDVHSHALINWADLIMFSQSSIMIDAIIKDKPVLHLRSTIANRYVFEHLMKNWSIECRDDVVRWVERLLKDKKTRTYTKEEAKACLDLIVNDGDGKLMERYATEVLSVGSGDELCWNSEESSRNAKRFQEAQ